MISKKVSMKTPEKSRFGKLVSYLVNDQGKHTRVGEVTITNCVSTDLPLALREIAATQQLNTRAQSDRTYHLLISFRAGEHPDAHTLKAVEQRFCAELGYGDHQRISVVHRDTDNVHIHIAINKIHPENLTIHDPKADYRSRSKLCAVLEYELGLAQDRHDAKERHSRSNDMEAMSGEQSFRSWIAQYAQHFLDATDWQELHGIADAYSVRLQIRANGFVFVDKESGVAAKASDVHRQLAKPALEARFGKFVDAQTIQARAARKAYRKKPLQRVNTEQLWREYTAERDARRTLYEAKHVLIQAETAQRIRAAKNDAANRRLAARLLFKGVARQANYFAINVALGRTIRAIYRHADQQRQNLALETRQLSWLDWLQSQAQKGRADALQALRGARRSAPFLKHLIPADQSRDTSPVPQGAQITKQGAIIETVAGYAIRRDEAGIYLDDQDRAPDEAVIAMLHHATNMFGTTLKALGRESFQVRMARVAGLNHLQIHFEDPAIEKVRLEARALAPVPISRAAQSYIDERNSKRDRISDIPFHRLWQSSDAGQITFNGLRVVDNQNLLLVSHGAEIIVLPISPQQRRQLAPIQRGTRLTISSQLLIQTAEQGLEL
jgi:Relaxase/Mobilisation nuclease domain